METILNTFCSFTLLKASRQLKFFYYTHHKNKTLWCSLKYRKLTKYKYSSFSNHYNLKRKQ